MREGHPNGGIPDQVIDLMNAGYLSTGELSRQLGIGASLPTSFIITQLGIQPRISLGGRPAMYWAPEQLSEVRRALIKRLIAAEFDA